MTDQDQADHEASHETCMVPGCARAASDAPPPGFHGLCVHHMTLAAPRLRDRVEAAARRLAAIQTFWDDEERYDRIVASDRYLKLSHATCCATDALDIARQRLMLAAVSAAGHVAQAPQTNGNLAARA